MPPRRGLENVVWGFYKYAAPTALSPHVPHAGPGQISGRALCCHLPDAFQDIARQVLFKSHSRAITKGQWTKGHLVKFDFRLLNFVVAIGGDRACRFIRRIV